MKRLLLALLLAGCGMAKQPLEALDPGQCFYCGPPSCDPCVAWHQCNITEAEESHCSGHADCSNGSLLSYADAGCWGIRQ